MKTPLQFVRVFFLMSALVSGIFAGTLSVQTYFHSEHTLSDCGMTGLGFAILSGLSLVALAITFHRREN
jgi:hypothetical protein